MLSDQPTNPCSHEVYESSHCLQQPGEYDNPCPSLQVSPRVQSEPYRYIPLDANKKEIRLIRENSRNPDEGILAFEVTIVSLLDAPEYTALSYVWGSPDRVDSVTLNGKSLPVTENLYRLLHRARELKHTYMWVDAICINQEDILERNSQVQLMGDVYSNASKVAAYVGDASKENLAAVQTLTKKIHANYLIMEAGQSLTNAGLKQKMKRVLTRKNSSYGTSEEWNAFHRFLDQPYFSRCWVLQEVVLGHDVEIWFGDVSFPYDILFEWIDLASNMKGWYLSFKSISPVSRASLSGKYISHLKTVILLIPSTTGDEVQIDEMPLIELLSASRELDATDPRDKVYGLLGLARKNQDSVILPDYSLSNTAENVCIQVARHCINTQDGAIYMLHCAGISAKSNLPSWVPDWTIPEVDPILFGMYNCSGSTTATIRLGDKLDSISVHGAVVDRVSILANTLPASGPEDFYKSAKLLGESIELHGRYVTGEKMDDVLRRTLSCDSFFRLGNYRRMGDLFRGEFEAFARSCKGSKFTLYRKVKMKETLKHVGRMVGNTQTKMANSFAGKIRISQSYGSLGTTDNNFIGFLPKQTQLGDVIVIIFGATTPFVLRPVDDAYILIGECYVHGIMDGELMHIDEETKAAEVKGSIIQDFTII